LDLQINYILNYLCYKPYETICPVMGMLQSQSHYICDSCDMKLRWFCKKCCIFNV